MVFNVTVNSKCSDQPAYPHSLIRACAARIHHDPGESIGTKQRFYLDNTDSQTGLSLAVRKYI